MKAHIISKLIFKRVGNGKKISFYDVEEKIFSQFSIDSKNKKITIEDLHSKFLNPHSFSVDLEVERSKLETKYAKAVDKIINSKLNNPSLSESEAWDIIVYFNLQAFITQDNIKNNKNIFIKKMKKIVSDVSRNLSEDEISKITNKINDEYLFLGESSINSKFNSLLNKEGPYFKKAEITLERFKPIVLKLKNNKAFYTDKFFRMWPTISPEGILYMQKNGLIGCHSYFNEEDIAYGMTNLLVGPLTNEKLLIFVRKDLCGEFKISLSDADFSILENSKLENLLFIDSSKLFPDITNGIPFMKFQKPTKYIFFNENDKEWVLNYLELEIKQGT